LAAAACALSVCELAAGAGANAQWDPWTPTTPFRNAAFYTGALANEVGILPASALLGIWIWMLVRAIRGRERNRNDFYVVWALCALGLTLALPFHDARYL